MNEQPKDILHFKVEELERQMEGVHQRNRRVELEKAWETSFARIAIITASTYLICAIMLIAINVSDALLKALVATLCYVISTLTIPLIKNRWIARRRYRGISKGEDE